MEKYKVCMVGDFAVGKTSLTQKFVNNVFSDKYLTTIGVKIDSVEIDTCKLIVWDVAGRDSLSPINANYLVGAAGIVLVGDGTRLATVEALESLWGTVQQRIGEVPAVVALNKKDHEAWSVTDEHKQFITDRDWVMYETSAKSGENVAEAFNGLLGLIKK